MTALGKLTVLLVFILSLAWFGMTVNLFVTRNNWKIEAEKQQKAAKQLEEANATLISRIQSERDSADSAKQVYAADRARQDALIKDMDAQYIALNSSYNQLLADQRKQDVAQTEKLALQKKAQDEIDTKTAQVKKLETELDILTRSTQLALNESSDAQREAGIQKQRAEKFADDLRRLSEQLQDLKQSGATAKGGVARPLAPEGFRGTVQVVAGNLVEFTPGGNTGLRANTRLIVYREAKGNVPTKFLGHITVSDQIDPDKAVGTFELSSVVKAPKAEDYPKKGDIIIAGTTQPISR